MLESAEHGPVTAVIRLPIRLPDERHIQWLARHGVLRRAAGPRPCLRDSIRWDSLDRALARSPNRQRSKP